MKEMDPDDIEYRKSVRNTIVVVTIVVVVIAAALVVSPYLNPRVDTFQKHVYATTTNGFTFNLQVNTTSLPTTGYVAISAWANSTSASTNNVTGADFWPFDHARLAGRLCTNGWPIGIGVMQGHYTVDNYTQGTLIDLPQPAVLCPATQMPPHWFEFEPPPHSSRALVIVGDTPEIWVIQSSVVFGQGTMGPGPLSAGIYTALAADEWGDLLLTNFRVG
jgi:hypothetical protein